MSFDRGETKIKDFIFTFKSSTTPGTYKIKIKALKENDAKGLYDGTFEVLPNYNIEGKIEKESSFLKTKTIVRKKNHGNGGHK